MNFKFILGLICLLGLSSCEKEDEKVDSISFELSETALNFSNEKGKQTFRVLNAAGELKVNATSDDSNWCTAQLNVGKGENEVEVSVEENVLVKSRTAKIEVTEGNHTLVLIVRQAQKYFTEIKAVQDVVATSQPGAVGLTWKEPKDDNFNGVQITVKTQDGTPIQVVKLEKGVTAYTVQDLLSVAGEYLFQLQSYDYEMEWGQMAEARCSADKKVSFRFKNVPGPSYVGYHFKATNEMSTSVSVGSAEFNPGEQVTISFDTDEAYLAEYNKTHHTNILLMSPQSYQLEDFHYDSSEAYQKMTIKVNTTGLQDRKTYGIPVRISGVSSNFIEEKEKVALLIYQVDDLQGWYTVERLEKCGEGEGSYPKGIRRYIKRTGDFSWETGYLFAYYTKSTDATGAAPTNLQYITLDPKTKEIHIQQGNYETSKDLNLFDPVTNELHIEYLYSAWSGWWTHERMFNRSYSK